MENKKYIVESLSDGVCSSSADGGDIVLEGCFTTFNVKNRNNRIYDSKNFLEKLNALTEKIKNHDLLGELEHPANMRYVSYQNVSHIVESLSYDQKTDSIKGRIKLLNTPSGRIAKTLIENKVPLHISSRAIGTLTPDNHVVVEELITYDLVAEPGFENAVLHAVNESKGAGSDALINAVNALSSQKNAKMKSRVILESFDGADLYELQDEDSKEPESGNAQTKIDGKSIIGEFRKALGTNAGKMDITVDSDMGICSVESNSDTAIVNFVNDHVEVEFGKNVTGEFTDIINNAVEQCLNNIGASITDGPTVQDGKTYFFVSGINFNNYYMEQKLGNPQDVVTRRDMDKYTKYLSEYLNKLKKGVVTSEDVEKYTAYLSEHLAAMNKNMVTSDAMEKYTGYLSEHLKKMNKDVVTSKDMERYTAYLSEHLDKNTVTAEMLEGYTKYLSESFDKVLQKNKQLNEKIEMLQKYTEYISESQTKINKKLSGKMQSIVEAADKSIEDIKMMVEGKQRSTEDSQLQNLVESVNSIASSIKDTNNKMEQQSQAINEQKSVTEAEKLIQFMPDYLKESWSALSDNRKKEILSESKLYIISSVDAAVRFWKTRNLTESVNSQDTKKYLSESLRNQNKNVRNEGKVQASIAEEIKRRLKYGF